MAILERAVPAQATAGTPQETVIGECEHGGTVKAVSVIPAAAVTANATAYRTISVRNKRQTGAASDVIAELPLNTPGTDDLVAFDEKDFPLGATLDLNDGDVLSVLEVITGAGVAHGGYTVKVLW